MAKGGTAAGQLLSQMNQSSLRGRRRAPDCCVVGGITAVAVAVAFRRVKMFANEPNTKRAWFSRRFVSSRKLTTGK